MNGVNLCLPFRSARGESLGVGIPCEAARDGAPGVGALWWVSHRGGGGMIIMF